MASINNTTPDIVVNAIRDADEPDVINFVIENEYYLKKLSVGAHVVKVQSSPILHDLYYNCCSPPMSCDNYVILYNLTDNSQYDIKVLLFNYAVEKLNKEKILFSIRLLKQNNKSNESYNNVDDLPTATPLSTESIERHVNENNMESFIEDGSPTAAKRQKFDDVQQN